MILRNVTLASERQVLGLQAGAPHAAARPAQERRVAHLEVVAHGIPTPPPLSIDLVSAWLEDQAPEARAVCARILAADLTRLKDAARMDGYEQGQAQGRADAAALADSSIAVLAQIAAAADEAFNLEVAQLSDACTDIVAEIFFKLAGSHLAAREAVLGSVLEVLARVKDERDLTIRVSAADLPLLQSHEAALRDALGSRRWTLSADSRVSVGGCLVESAVGTLDGRLEIQLRELCETIRAAKNARLEDM